MSLIDETMTECVEIRETTVSDGVGGYTTTYSEGDRFMASIAHSTATDSRTGMKADSINEYKIYTAKNLDFHKIIKRLSDGQLILIENNADDRHTPPRASFSIRVYVGREWSVT